MAFDAKVLAAVRAAFPRAGAGSAVPIGAPVHDGQYHPEPLIGVPLAMLNRHGLVAGATGTGKTKTLQLMTEGLSAAGVPVFVADIKGDVAGLAEPGQPSPRIEERAKEIGVAWRPSGFPIELLSLSGKLGAQLRATVSSFGPLALGKVMGLNDTQASVLSLVFKYCDDRRLPLLDFKDLRAVLTHLTDAPAEVQRDYGGISKASVGVLLREMVQMDQMGAAALFGEPELEIADLMERAPDGRGRISVLELSDVQDKPALFSTFMMWMLAELYHQLPEIGDVDRPKLVFFFDEAHLLFKGASKAFLDQVEQVVRLVRSKGVGIFFVTQSPKDVPPTILAQLGNRVQHALRAFTPDDEKALRAAARTFPKTSFYDIPQTLTTLGIGEALVTVLGESGAPSPPFVARVAPPASRMGPLSAEEMAPLLRTEQVRRYATAIDRQSAYEILDQRFEPGSANDNARPEAPEEKPPAPRPAAPARTESAWHEALHSPVARTIAGQVTRGLMGALLGPPPRRRRTRSAW
jgi:DNA double-strand break repair helicase HerA and related ATPase